MKFVRFTKIICVRNSWCIMRILNALMHALNALMHALMMHHNIRVDDALWYTRWCTRWCTREYAYNAVYVNTHAMQSAWMRMRCSLRECVYDAVCVNAYAMQSAWMRMRYSLREYVCDAACVNTHTMQFTWFIKSVKSTKPLLPNLNNHCRFQIIMLAKTWFKSINQLIVSSGINSFDLTDKIFCWWFISNIRRRIRLNIILF